MAESNKDPDANLSTASWDSQSCLSSTRTSLCDVLRSLIVNNIDHFCDERTPNTNEEIFHRTFVEMLELLNLVEAEVNKVARFASEYDFDRSVPGNGHRSFVAVFDAFVVHSIRLCRQVCLDRGASFLPNVFGRRERDLLQEVTAHTQVLGCLQIAMRHLNALRCWSEPGSLFPSPEHSPEELLIEAGDMDTSCFYGRCLGFQFSESMRKPLKFIALAMTSFSEAYFNDGGVMSKTATSIISCGRYAYYPEERARRIVNISHRASVDFCKAFWLLQENYFVQQFPGIVCPQLLVNKIILLPVEPLKLPRHGVGPQMCDIPIPSSYFPPAPVTCRLLSAFIRDGQLDDSELGKHSVMPKSPYLIIQVHGGGFVAQSSKSHEVYLRDWATQLNVPIMCIDYSLAPEAPFPRPLEECVYAYAWSIQNCHRLGSTGEKICLVGDSAGGNLIIGVAMKAIELGVRKPDAIFALYTPLLIDFIPSPSRLLCLMDPLLPFGFMLRCLQAYAGLASTDERTDKAAGEHSDSNSASEKSTDKVSVATSTSNLDDKANVNSVAQGVGVQKLVLSESESFEEVSPSEIQEDLRLEESDVKFENCDPKTQDEDRSKFKGAVDNSVDWYILDVDESKNLAVLRSETDPESEENVHFEIRKDLPRQISEKVGIVAGRVMNGISGFLPNKTSTSTKDDQLIKTQESISSTGRETSSDNLDSRKGTKLKDASTGSLAERKLGGACTMRVLIEEFQKIKVNQSYYLSPYLAPDNVLGQLPSTRFLLDPCLDDAVMMCKRLRKLGVDIGLDIVDNLPHGFLNFAPISKDAHVASRLCVQRLREMLKLPADFV